MLQFQLIWLFLFLKSLSMWQAMSMFFMISPLKLSMLVLEILRSQPSELIHTVFNSDFCCWMRRTSELLSGDVHGWTRLWASWLTMITFTSCTIQTRIGVVDHAPVQDCGPVEFVKIIMDKSQLFTYERQGKDVMNFFEPQISHFT